MPLEVIENEVCITSHWEGRLVHQRRDGSNVVVTVGGGFYRLPSIPLKK